MSDVNNQVIRAVPLLRALVAKLQALEWEPAGGGAVPAFGSVVIYDLRDQAEAMKDLLGLDQRQALVIYEGDKWTGTVDGRHLNTEVVREVSVVVSDRQLGDRQAALVGSANNPGALLLSDLVLESVAGNLSVPVEDAANAVESRAWVEPVEAVPMVIEGKLRSELVGRSTKVLSLRIHSGQLMTVLDPYFV